MPPVTDFEFKAGIDEIAKMKGRINTASLPELFLSVRKHHSLAEFRAYLYDRYSAGRKDAFTSITSGRIKNNEYYTLEGHSLRSVNRRFSKDDVLSINFFFTDDWSEIVEFIAVISNRDMTGGPIGVALLLCYGALAKLGDLLFKR